MKKIGGFLFVFLMIASFSFAALAAQSLKAVKMANHPAAPFQESGDKLAQINGISSSLDRLYKLYIAKGDFRDYADLNRLTLKGENVMVTVLPAWNFTTDDIDESALIRLGAIIQAKARHSMRIEIPISQLANVATTIRGIAEIQNLIQPVADAVISEGIELMNADTWQAAGFTGSGVKTAIIDGGFYKLSSAQSNGDIPAAYYSLDLTGSGMEASSDGEHGTAVTEAVYDIAPGASFYLYKIDDLTDLENAKNDAISQGVQVINHSMSWFGLSYYDGTGGACNFAADAISHGITWVNSAGNHAEDHYRSIFIPNAENFHDFTGTSNKLNAMGPEPGYVWLFPVGTVIQVWMNWNNYPTTSEDYDLYLYRWNYSTSAWEVATSSINRQSNSSPTESVAYLNRTKDGRYAIAVKKYSATTNVDFTIFAGYGLSYHIVASSVTDPGSYTDVVTVGAISKNFYESGPQEYFSGQGPTTDGRPKPDVAAPDSCNSFAYGYWQGTSLSSPYTAGVCTLIKGRFPAYSNSEVRNYLYANCAVDLGTPGFDNVYGWGKVVLPNFDQVSISSPNGGEDWAVGSIHNITWTSSGTSGAVKIDYSVDNGGNWIAITPSTTDNGSYAWTIPYNPSATCLVKVSDSDDSPVDQSNAPFTISWLRISDLRASVQVDSILLEWSAVNGAASYNVYRGTSYDFVPDTASGTNRIGNQITDQDPGAAGIQWTDTGNGADVVGDVNNNYSYLVTALVPSQSLETDPSNLAGEFDYGLTTTSGTDINELVVLVNTQNTRTPITDAEQLAQVIPNCTDVYYWDAAGQGTVGHPKGLPFGNFAVIPGYPYIANVTAATVWSVAGSYTMPVFNLITTSGTDINHLTVPLEKSDLTTAEALGNDIPNCTDVYYWDAAGQGTVGHVVGLPFGDFAVHAGNPYYVNVTAASTWPSGSGMNFISFASSLNVQKEVFTKASGSAGAPHTVYGKLSYSKDRILDSNDFKINAWMADRPEEVLTQDNVGTGCDGGYWWVGVSNFATKWTAGEKLIVQVVCEKLGLNISTSVELTTAGSDYAGEINCDEAIHVTCNKSVNLPQDLELQPGYPNPFNSVTEIRFGMPKTGHLQIKIWDVSGRLVRTLVDGNREAGYHWIRWNGQDDSGRRVSSAIYFCTMETSGHRQVIKLVLTK